KPRFDFILKRFVVSRRDHAIRFSALHIKEYARVISAFAPDSCFGPIHIEFLERSQGRWIFVQYKQPFANKPFIDRNSAVEPLRTMIGDNQHKRIVAKQL